MNNKYPKKRNEFNNRVLTLGEITDESSNEIVGLIYEINEGDAKQASSKRDPIKIIINSFGGNTYYGFGIIDAVESSVTPVHTICHGAAMSMALAIMVSGHNRISSPRSTFMYHDIWWDSGEKNYLQHKESLEEGKRVKKMYDDYLVNKTKITLKQLNSFTKQKKEWYISATEAMALDIVYSITQ